MSRNKTNEIPTNCFLRKGKVYIHQTQIINLTIRKLLGSELAVKLNAIIFIVRLKGMLLESEGKASGIIKG